MTSGNKTTGKYAYIEYWVAVSYLIDKDTTSAQDCGLGLSETLSTKIAQATIQSNNKIMNDHIPYDNWIKLSKHISIKRHCWTYVKTKNKVVDPTRRVAAVDTGIYLVGLNLFPALLGIL